MVSTRTAAPLWDTTHCGTRGLSELLQGPWLGGLLGLCGIGGHQAPCAGPSGRWLASEPASRTALTSELGLYKKQNRVSCHEHLRAISCLEKWVAGFT